MLVIHIDDILGAGNRSFVVKVVEPLLKRFPFGETLKAKFRFTGINMEYTERGLPLDQRHYVESMKEVPVSKESDSSNALDWYGQTGYRSLQGAEGWTANRTRADASYDVSAAATKMRTGTVGDLKELNKTLKYLKSTNQTKIFYPKFPKPAKEQKWRLLGVCDSSLMNCEDGKSQRGVLIWIAEDRPSSTGPIVAHLIYWESKKGARIVRSSLAAETHAVQETVSLLMHINDLYAEYEGHRIPADVRSDAESLVSHLKTGKRTSDLRLYYNVCQVKEDLADGRIRSVLHIKDEHMLADCLTKKNVAKRKREMLRHAMVTGTLRNVD